VEKNYIDVFWEVFSVKTTKQLSATAIYTTVLKVEYKHVGYISARI